MICFSSPNLADVKVKDTFAYLNTWCRGPANRVDTIRRFKENMATSKPFRTTLWSAVVIGIIASGWRSHFMSMLPNSLTFSQFYIIMVRVFCTNWYIHFFLDHGPHLTPTAYQLVEMRELHKEILHTPKANSSETKH